MTGAQVAGIVRTLLAAAGGWAMSTFAVTASEWEAIVGGLAVAIAAGWSYFSKPRS
jgi:hypothetical protein